MTLKKRAFVQRYRRQGQIRIWMMIAALLFGAPVHSQEYADEDGVGETTYTKTAADYDDELHGLALQDYVIYQTVERVQPVILRDANGQPFARVHGSTILEVQVPRIEIQKSVTASGIDAKRLSDSIPKISSPAGDLVRAKVPYTHDESALKSDRDVYVEAEVVARPDLAQPVGTRGAPSEIAEAFNQALEKNGVIGAGKIKPVAHPYVPLNRAEHSNHTLTDRFLSSPTCDCKGIRCTMTSNFSRNRRSLRTLDGSMTSHLHLGQDIGGRPGTPIVASADGCVKRKVISRIGYGNSIYLEHGNGFETQYSHMRGFAANAREGQCFKRGEVLGYMGQTGQCTGPHLHFGVKKNGVAVDPRDHLLTRSDSALSLSCRELRDEAMSLEPPRSESTVPTLSTISITEDEESTGVD